MCEHRVDPDDTEYTGSQDDDNGGRDTFSDATGSSDAAIHKTAEGIAASITAGSVANSDRNCRPKIRSSPPRIAPEINAYVILMP